MNEEQMWSSICRTVAIGIIGLSATIAGCTGYTHYQITQSLAAGADPLAVACAHGNDGSGTACAVLAAKR